MVNDIRFLERFSFREQYLAGRAAKAEKILSVLQREGVCFEKCRVLDIGCSQGQITQRMAERFQSVVGIDLDREPWQSSGTLHFLQGNACHLPLASSAFDVVLLNHTLEHVEFPEQLMREIWRVLRPRGLCYLACPNRFSLVEPHYRLPFLSWLPRPLADAYVRWTGRGNEYLDHLPSYWSLKRLIKPFAAEHLTSVILKHPERFLQNDLALRRKTKWVGWIPLQVLKWLSPLYPVWIFVLRKKEDNSEP
ncbi:MAG: class I SAM-dependent methyltransferase [Terriglobia bacterium]